MRTAVTVLSYSAILSCLGLGAGTSAHPAATVEKLREGGPWPAEELDGG
jgi:hypothetical protein